MTGNTAALADRLHELLPADSCVYFGDPSPEVIGLDADLFFVGFWTDRGSCDSKTRVLLKKLDHKTIVLFGTAGFGSDPEYFNQVLSSAAANASVSNTVLPGFMCQGRMKPEAKEKFEALLAANPGDERAKKMLLEYDLAASHPDESDFAAFEAWAGAFRGN